MIQVEDVLYEQFLLRRWAISGGGWWPAAVRGAGGAPHGALLAASNRFRDVCSGESLIRKYRKHKAEFRLWLEEKKNGG